MLDELVAVFKRANEWFVFFYAFIIGAGMVIRKMIYGAQKLDKLYKVMDNVQKEFTPNGGSSLRDAINTLIARADTTDKTVKEIREHTSKLDKSIKVNAARQWASISGSALPMFECNDLGDCVRANPVLLKLLQRTSEEYLGKGWELCVYPEDRKHVVEEWQAAVASKRNFEATYRVKSSSGAVYIVDCVATALTAYTDRGDKEILGYIGVFNNVRLA